MMRFVFVFLFLTVYLGASPSSPRTTSIIVPCHSTHAQYLFELLAAFSKQTVLPSQVVISLSDEKNVPSEVIQNLELSPWPFELVLLRWEEKVSEGGNRNRACEVAKGDIFICQDADDLPHPQRIEIIRFFFENHPIDYLLHSFYIQHNSLYEVFLENNFNINDLCFYCFNSTEEAFNSGLRFATGVISISRKTFEKIQWNESFELATDREFYEKTSQLAQGIILSAPIYFYRANLSSYSVRSLDPLRFIQNKIPDIKIEFTFKEKK